MKVYVSNASYPELRGLTRRFDQTKAWWGAFRAASRAPWLWSLLIIQFILLGCAIMLGAALADGRWGVRWTLAPVVVVTAGLVLTGAIVVTVGGDLMRSYLRRTSAHARETCPGCGHVLTPQREAAATDRAPGVRCPECGADVPLALFEVPYRIPREFRAIPWGPTRDGSV